MVGGYPPPLPSNGKRPIYFRFFLLKASLRETKSEGKLELSLAQVSPSLFLEFLKWNKLKVNVEANQTIKRQKNLKHRFSKIYSLLENPNVKQEGNLKFKDFGT